MTKRKYMVNMNDHDDDRNDDEDDDGSLMVTKCGRLVGQGNGNDKSAIPI